MAPPPRLRVGHIADLMLRKRYVKGVTAPELAVEWGLEVNTVEHDAVEASRLLKAMGEPEAVKEIAMLECSRIVAESGQDRVPALRLMLEATGNLKQKHEVIVQTKPDADVFAEALRNQEFQRWLVAQGWRPPVVIETTGETT